MRNPSLDKEGHGGILLHKGFYTLEMRKNHKSFIVISILLLLFLLHTKAFGMGTPVRYTSGKCLILIPECPSKKQ